MERFQTWISRAWRLAVVLPLLMGGLLRGSPAGAQDAPDTPQLEYGPWSGSGQASGVATASQAGMDMTWDGSVTVDLNLSVSSDGPVDGSWSHQGSATMTMDGSIAGHKAHADADTTFSGPGTVGGDNQVLSLAGSSHTTGTIRVESGGKASSFPIGTTDAIPTMKVTILFAECDEAYGDFQWAVEQAYQGVGLSSDLDGSMMLVRNTSEIQDQLKQLQTLFTGGNPDPSQSPLFNAITQYVHDVNQMVEAFPNWSMDQVMDDLAKAEQFLNTLRNLRKCEKRFFGQDNVEYFAQALTWQIQQLIIGGAGLEGLTGDAAFKLLQAGTRVGAFGPGAPNPAQAVKAEDALRQGCQHILEQNEDPNGDIFVNEDTQKAMLVGAIMDWTYNVAGTEYPARATYEGNGYNWKEDGSTVEAPQ